MVSTELGSWGILSGLCIHIPTANSEVEELDDVLPEAQSTRSSRENSIVRMNLLQVGFTPSGCSECTKAVTAFSPVFLPIQEQEGGSECSNAFVVHVMRRGIIGERPVG